MTAGARVGAGRGAAVLAEVWVTSCSGHERGESVIFRFDSVVETADETPEASEEASGWTSAVKLAVITEASSEEPALAPGSKDSIAVALSEKNSWVV